jgi:hypothetical protein
VEGFWIDSNQARHRNGSWRTASDTQENALLFTELNSPLTLWPKVAMIANETVMMKAAITAYSTAVGPSSLARNRRIFEASLHIPDFLLKYFSKTADSGKCLMLATRHRVHQRGCERVDHESELFTELNVLLTLLPSVVTIVAQTAMIRANMTPYSTAVGPSSLTKKRCTFKTKLFIANSSSGQSMKRNVRETRRANAALS